MARTTRRQTFNVPTGSGNYSKPQFFNQVEFKGLCTNQNDVTVDPQSFSDVRNMLVDENGVLVSRPPFKFADGESNIVDERQFGLYKIRLYRLHKEYDGVSYFVFLLRCVSHDTIEGDDKFTQYSWWIPTTLIDDKEVPKISYAQIEDKIFIWFAGIDFVALNTTGSMIDGEKYLYFEDATKYLYTPIHKLIISGIETELEEKNLLASNYYKRYQYSLMSDVDFPSLAGSSMRVNLSKKDIGEKYLYDIVVDEYHKEALLYPYSFVGEDVHIDAVRTSRTTVFLSYNSTSQQIRVSFDGRYFRTILHDDFVILGNPIITKDGLWLVAFTTNGLKKCKLVAQESSDFVELKDIFEWESEAYYLPSGSTSAISSTTIPVGDFDTIDNFVYVIPVNDSASGDYYSACIGWTDGANGAQKSAGPIFGTIANSPVTQDILGIRYRFNRTDFITSGVSFFVISNKGTSFVITAMKDTSNGFKKYGEFVLSTNITIFAFNTNINGDILVAYRSNYDHYMTLHYHDNPYLPLLTLKDEKTVYEKSDFFYVSSDCDVCLTNLYIRKDEKTIPLPFSGQTIVPIYGKDGENWYLVDGELWTSKLTDDIVIELDEEIDVSDGIKLIPPDYHAVMNTNYFAYETPTGEYLLEATETRRENGGLLLYAPQTNEQRFTGKITALHPLSDSQMGIFTDDGIWYISMMQNDSGLVLYSQPIRSKLPVKLRDGDEVVTALDGQALIFPTTRGIVALAPQDFIATTEKTISYITDIMQEKYRHFYDDEIINANLYYNKSLGNVPFDGKHRPEIKICTYNYWLLFYKYLDAEILAFDTRSSSWWSWSVPYPIRSITADERLHLLLQIDHNPKSVSQSLAGVSFVLTNQDVSYSDDVVDNTLTGKYSIVHDNDYMGDTFVLHSASSDINWYFTSQRLGFGQINNYKAIKAINMNLRGDDVNAKLYTRAYRDAYHPEQENVVEIKINELCTFVKRFNLVHVLDFQYRIENDKEVEIPHQFQLNSLSLKYEVKEGVR